MALNFYKRNLKTVLSYAQERIIDFLEEHDNVGSKELYVMSSNQSKPLKRLVEAGVVEKNENGKYQLQSDLLHDITHGYVLNVRTRTFHKVRNTFYD